MPLVRFITHDGNEYEAEAEVGSTLMQAAVANGIDAILAECGGGCICATCHCYIDTAWLERMPKALAVEKDMLGMVREPEDNSRLSCQITLTDEHEGLVVRLPRSQY